MIKIQSPNFKSSNVVEYNPPKPNLLHRHVEWLKGESPLAVKSLKILLASLEVLLLSMTIVGIKVVVDAFALSNRIDSEKLFFKEVKFKKPPLESEEIHLKSPTRTFNHINEYAIEDNTIWFRHKGSKTWKPLYFDGYAEKKIPTAIDCDGANLVVLDNENVLHYKKIFKEFRGKEINLKTNRHFQSLDVHIQPDDYYAVDKSSKNNWKDRWFNLPFLHHLVNFFNGKKLKLPPSVKSVAISHRGRYNSFTEDAAGQRHHVTIGVTTLYVLASNGREIYKYDPWSPKCAKVSISLPETPDTSFEAKRIAAAGSVVMAVGYESRRETNEKTLKVLTKLSDIDTEGGNPLLKYDFFKNEANSNVRVLPVAPRWDEHPLHLRGAAVVSDHITIFQTGEGDQARELRIQGKDEHGQFGYYRKQLKDAAWEFVKTSEAVAGPTSFLPSTSYRAAGEVFETSVHDYQGELALKTEKVFKASLKNFGFRSSMTHLNIEAGGRNYSLPIYKRLALKNYLGFKGSKYDLVIPDIYANSPQLKEIFGSKKVIRLDIKETSNQVMIKSSSKNWNADFKKQF